MRRLLLMVLVAASTISCDRGAQPLSVGIATWPGFGPVFVAKQQGFFDGLPVKPQLMDDFSVRQNAFTSGKTEATISTLDSFAFEAGQGVKGRVVLVLDESSGADGMVVAPSITAPSDLRGKKIAYTRGSPSHFLLLNFLKANNLTPQDIQALEVDDPGRAGDAFVSGKVDAAVTWEPNISQITKSGRGRLMVSTKTMPGLIVDVLVASPYALERRRDAVVKLVSGWLKAVEYIKTNQREAYSIMARNLKIPETDFPGMAGGLKYADLERNKQLLLPPQTSRAIEIFASATDFWKNLGLIRQPRPANDAVDASFITQLPTL